jgi:hypothetical protein
MQTEYTITGADAVNVLQIIDLCAKRGAFQGNELGAVASVRMVFDKIAAAVNAAAQVDQGPAV